MSSWARYQNSAYAEPTMESAHTESKSAMISSAPAVTRGTALTQTHA